ncbi:MAG TPA: TIGR04282 family arsenosugar biosynthesis glycosyltransferase [Cryomorphaceae bacterium]|nr:TIGR04282 family arsenosugar biosynthesis glycosyltransferase [Cryomorphaceae bacterium]
MNHDSLLIVFAKNPELGKVKTRLARTIGDEKALMIYLKLLEHTHAIADKVFADKAVFYSEKVQDFDILDYYKFPKFLQKGRSLGERMDRAIGQAFAQQYEKVVIIGSDCFELSTEIIEDALRALDDTNVVVGPAVDGGYYLLGMDRHYPHLFKNKNWSSEDVFLDTLLDIKKLNLSYTLMPTLNDVDEEKDLGELRKHLA